MKMNYFCTTKYLYNEFKLIFLFITLFLSFYENKYVHTFKPDISTYLYVYLN